MKEGASKQRESVYYFNAMKISRTLAFVPQLFDFVGFDFNLNKHIINGTPLWNERSYKFFEKYPVATAIVFMIEDGVILNP